MPFGPRDVPGTHFGEFVNFLDSVGRQQSFFGNLMLTAFLPQRRLSGGLGVVACLAA